MADLFKELLSSVDSLNEEQVNTLLSRLNEKKAGQEQETSKLVRNLETGKIVACPYCDTTDVKRVPTASYVLASRDKEKTDYTQREFEDMLRHKAIASARKLLKDSVDVGEQFPQEARAVHQGKSPKRTIHGRCTADEALELLEEGIPVLPLPEGTVRTTN